MSLLGIGIVKVIDTRLEINARIEVEISMKILIQLVI